MITRTSRNDLIRRSDKKEYTLPRMHLGRLIPRGEEVVTIANVERGPFYSFQDLRYIMYLGKRRQRRRNASQIADGKESLNLLPRVSGPLVVVDVVILQQSANKRVNEKSQPSV